MKQLFSMPRYLKMLYVASTFTFLLVGSTTVQAYWPHGCCDSSSDCLQPGYVCCWVATWGPCYKWMLWQTDGYCGDSAWNCELAGHGA
jgi:hypothetical protein